MTAATVLRERQVRGGKRSVPLRGDRKGPASEPRSLQFLGWVWPPALSQIPRAAEPTAGVTPCPHGLHGAEAS